ncbi:MAG: insulinase family protein [Verrucomicrobia bacterium]|nr:insulinase family protein [Verrucomicrobiota bacterium]
MFRHSRLSNGLVVATAAMPHRVSTSLGLWIGVGGRHEPAAWNGAAHFIEHMLFKGTARRSPREISQAVEGVGGSLNAFTSEENTCFFSKALHDRLPDLLDVLMDMFLHSRFAPRDIDLERDVIKDEVAMYLDEPQHHVQELINETLWPDHPLGRPLTGTLKTLNRLRREHLLEFMRQNYVAANTVIAVAGRLRHEDVLQMVGRYASRLPQGPPAPFTPVVSTQDRPRVKLFTKDGAQTQIVLGVRTCSRHDERRFALRLLNAMLGENMSSRLFQELREDRGLAYSIQSALSFFHDVGTLDISVGLDTENLPQAVGLILRELRRLADKPPPRAELHRARDYVLGQFDLSLENTENQMNWLGENWLGFGKIFAPADIKRRLAEVKAADISAVARDFFRPDRMNLALVSPLKSARKLERLLGP